MSGPTGNIPTSAGLWRGGQSSTTPAGERLFQLEREGRVLVLAPVSTHKVSRIERDTKKLRMLWGDGYQQAVDRMDEIRAFLTPDRA